MARAVWVIVSLAWLLALASCGGGGGAGAIPAPEPPAAAASVSKLAGDGQAAAPGAVLPVEPAVLVRDAGGTPRSGIDVRCTVDAASGSVPATSVLTDASGRASCGRWTLGLTVGIQTLQMAVPGLPAVSFAATAARTSAEVAISLLAPSTPVVGSVVAVAAKVTSTYQIATISAAIAGVSAPMTYGTYRGAPAWLATLSIDALPRGDQVLVVTATDVRGSASDVVRAVTLDRAPQLGVSSPAQSQVVQGMLAVEADCSDDDPAGCVSLQAAVDGKVLATASGARLRASVDLSAFQGRSLEVVISGSDSRGQLTASTRRVYVETSPRLSIRGVFGGTVWDVLADRVLYVDLTGSLPALTVADTASGRAEVIETTTDLVGTWGCYGYLTRDGALYVRGQAANAVSPYAWLFEWRSGSLANLGGVNSSRSLRVAGSHAIYNTPGLWRRDLAAGVSTLVSGAAGNVDNDIGANGDVAYWSNDYQIRRWRAGTDVRLTDNAAGVWNTYPLTDGTNVVYRKSTPCCNNQTWRIAMHDGVVETVLAGPTATEPAPGFHYAAGGGFVAFVVEDAARSRQVWRRSPGGSLEALTFFGSSSTIEAMAEDGSVIVANGALARRYLARPGAPLQEVGSLLGRVMHRDGRFVVIIDRTVLVLVP